MGARVDGKKKKKSIKANVTSKFNSKRKLSRMGKRVQKGKMGPNTEFITRSSALRKLQISLKDFRRLCILKGIYPRVPSKALKGADKIYYDIKDISYIAHEPLLNKFREFKAFMKKIRRAAGRNQFEEARRKNDLKPKITLDHLVKERYPRFIDALRDLDDCLCMIHLFASLPSIGRITAEHTSTCAKLAREWQYFVSKSHALRKVFVSVKGVYFQAEIMGEPITWLVPHKFTQILPKEVDFRVMLTFLEFYEVFVKFVLYKLYHINNWQYPPVVDKDLDAEGCCLLAMKSDSMVEAPVETSLLQDKKSEAGSKSKDKSDPELSAKLSTLLAQKEEDEEDDDEEDEFDNVDINAPLVAVFSDLQQTISNQDSDDVEKKVFLSGKDGEAYGEKQLFDGMVFFLNREVPLDWLQLCITSLGGRVGWDGPMSPFDVSSPSITHHIIDRPTQGNSKFVREYVQPQWVFDSINARIPLPTRLYTPGTKLPPHLSPFVDDEKEGYVPQYKEEIKKLQEHAGIKIENKKSSKSAPVDQEDVDDDEVDEEDYTSEVRKEKKKSQGKVEPEEEEDDDSDEESESEEEAEELAEVQYDNRKGPKAVVYEKKAKPVDEATEMKELSKQMMSKKTKRLYDRMQHGIEKKQSEIRNLENKRKVLDSDKPNTKSNKKSKSK